MARPKRIETLDFDINAAIKAQLTAAIRGETNENPPVFSDFCESTAAFSLHQWQRDYLCPLLERYRTEKGLRIILHAPSQVGKSFIVSQRLPAYLIGCDPKTRVGLACFNQDHAIAFGNVIKDLMLDEKYEKLFPNNGCRILQQGSATVSSRLFSTYARAAQKDGQYSFVALGMASGFTGKGVDTLIIDDPYASAEDARSEAVNGRTWRWWDETAQPRVGQESNVLVVYHRYSLDDLGGRLLEQGGWEFVRFPMIADDNELGDDPTTAPSPNPMRMKGELLSPLRTMEWVEARRELSPAMFMAQFQGTPLLGDATVFDVTKLRKTPYSELPPSLTMCRSYDFAASDGKGDWTVGVLLGIDFNKNNTIYILDMWRNRKATSARDAAIKITAEKDGYDVPIVIPSDPGAAGKSVTVYLTQELVGYMVKEESVSGDKVTKATPLAGQVNIGNVVLVEAPWNDDFIKELKSFPLGKHDDIVDAVAQGFNHLIKHPRGEMATSSLKTYAHIENESLAGSGVRVLTYEDGTKAVINRTLGRFGINRRF